MAGPAKDRGSAQLPDGGARVSGKVTRIAVICSVAQRDLLATAAVKNRSNLSTWVLAHAMKAAGANGHVGSGPIIIEGDVADRLRAAATRLEIDPNRLLEQLLIAEG